MRTPCSLKYDMRRLFNFLLVILIVTLTSCASGTDQKRLLSERTEAAEEALENGAENKVELLKVLLETDMERGWRSYQQTRMMMARFPRAEQIHDPPRHYRHREMVEKAKDADEITEEEYEELKELGDKVHDAWLTRRNRVSHDRAIWGFSR